MRIAAVGDLHCKKTSHGQFQALFSSISSAADVLVLCGDLTDYGLPDEARVLARELSAVGKMSVVAVLGNHDCESGDSVQIGDILAQAGVHVLDGDSCEIDGVGFAGVKGLGGGFGAHALQPWGEDVMKRFVREAVDEALKLESALARLRASRRVAVLHYAPIRETVEGEPVEIFPFLGSSRLEEPLLRYPVTAVFHGHAHHGALEGRTRGDTPVYNVCLPLLQSAFPEQPPFRLVVLDPPDVEVVASPRAGG